MTKWIIGAVALLVIIAGVAFIFKDSLFGGGSTQEPIATSTPQVMPTAATYASSTTGVSLMYPSNFIMSEEYVNEAFGAKKAIHGVSFTVPVEMATGTNLSSDTRLSVEQLPRAKKCTADIYILENVKAQNMTIGSTTYSVASTTGAAAGNRYEEIVYALPDSSPCTATRYFIHYGAIENYPVGTVREFDRSALLMRFDAIRDSLKVGM